MRVAFAGPDPVSGNCLITREQGIARLKEADDLKATDAQPVSRKREALNASATVKPRNIR